MVRSDFRDRQFDGPVVLNDTCEDFFLDSDSERVRNLLEEAFELGLLGHGILDFEEVRSNLILELLSELSILHGSVHGVNFSLIISRLGAELSDKDGDFTGNPGHENEAENVHSNDKDQFNGLSRLQLITANDQYRVVDHHRPDVGPSTLI